MVTGLKVEDPAMWSRRLRRSTGRRVAVPRRTQDDLDQDQF